MEDFGAPRFCRCATKNGKQRLHVDMDIENGDDCSDKFYWKQNSMSP